MAAYESYCDYWHGYDPHRPYADEHYKRMIRRYKIEITDALDKSLDGDFNLTEYLIKENYPQWHVILEGILSLPGETEDWQKHDPNELFDDAVEAMALVPQALSRAKLNSQTEKRRWMPVLLKHLDQLRRAPWLRLRGNDHLLDHLDAMSEFRRKNWPGKLIGNKEFDEIFAQFIQLGKNSPPTDRDEGRTLVHGSVHSVLDAARALLISLDTINIPLESLVNEETRPPCVDNPVSNPLFLSGTEKRPGAIALKAYLGGSHNESESQYPLDGSRSYSGEKRDFGVFSDPKLGTSEDGHTKRQAVGDGGSAGIKKKTGGADKSQGDYYNYTWEDADQEIEDLLLLAEGRELPPKHPGSVTPVLDIPSDYKSTILPKMQAWDWPREAVQARCPDQMTADLEELEKEMTLQRDYIVQTCAEGRFTYSNLKTLKCTAFVLRYMRAMYIRLLMMGRPTDDLLQARADRLADWTLHEEVWNHANAYSLSRTKPNFKNRPRLEREIRKRTAKIEDWRNQILALHKAMAKKETGKAAEAEANLDTLAKSPVAAAVQDNVNTEEEDNDIYTRMAEIPELVLSPSRYAVCMRNSTCESTSGSSGLKHEYHMEDGKWVRGELKKSQKLPKKFTVFAGGWASWDKDLPQEEGLRQAAVHDHPHFLAGSAGAAA
ncbi:hypothetical protein PG994_003048 [Apiospora phragmitis]|uniref:Uncharacterized protein n=1 Tax=Apiospora phragmitis TaxID=2905665 RepID=A0ABR1W6Z1_9PEZI